MGKLFCITLRDYASNEHKVREAIQELEQMFPPPKAEEGLSSQFQQIDRNNAFGNQFGSGFMPEELQEDKKGKNKKKGNANATSGTKVVVKEPKIKQTMGFEVPSTSSKQSRVTEEVKKSKKSGGQTKKNK